MRTLQLLQRVERVTLILGVLAVLASLIAWNLQIISGVILGTAIGWLNLVGIRTLSLRLTHQTYPKATFLGMFLLKFAALIGLVLVIGLLSPVSLPGFLVGFSTLVVASMVVPLVQGIRDYHPIDSLPESQTETSGRPSPGENEDSPNSTLDPN